jgi:hypothetical protein
MDSELDALRDQVNSNKPEPALSSRALAMTKAREIATRRSTAALRTFLDTTTWTPDKLRRVSAFAAMNGGEGAMALMLAAERRKPGDWATQYNIAMYLLLEGYPRASLALLDSLRAPDGARGPGGIDLQASLLLGRGNAMLALGRARAAIPLLRDARQREPVLSEAARALARAHLMLNEEKEAKRALFLARRFATRAQLQDAIEMIDPKKPGDPSVAIETIDDIMPLRLNQRWPFRKGYGEALRMMEPPSSPEGIKPFLAALAPEIENLNGRLLAATAVAQTAAQAYVKDTISWAFPGLRTQLHADANLPWGLVPSTFAFTCTSTEGGQYDGDTFDANGATRAAEERFVEERADNPQLAGYTRSLRRAAASACARLSPKYWMTTNAQLATRIDGCPSGPSRQACVCQAQRSIAGMQLNDVNDALQPYHIAAKQWYWMAHSQSSSTAGYVEPKDRTLRNMIKAEIDVHRTMTMAGVHQNMQLQYQPITALCVPEKPVPPDSIPADLKLKPFDSNDVCSSPDGMGVKQSFIVAEVKVSCYDIEVEGSVGVPGMGFKGVGSLTLTFGGEKEGNVTIFTGVGFGTPEGIPIAAGTKSGAYITFKDGEYTDSGFKVSAEVAVGNVAQEVSKEMAVRDVVLYVAGSVTYVSNEILVLLSP